MKYPEANIRVNVDVTNPGQFFACCGLLELADRLWPGAEGWFDGAEFCIRSPAAILMQLLREARNSMPLSSEAVTEEEIDTEENDDDDNRVSPIVLGAPFGIRLDWWQDTTLKTWAGSMSVEKIALAMSRAIDPTLVDPFSHTQIVYNPTVETSVRKRKQTKREPFYFDSRRGPNAHSRDVGFSADGIKIKTACSPATEFLALVGLQRFRPLPLPEQRSFLYWPWTIPCEVQIASAFVTGIVTEPYATAFRFVNGYRSGQKKHKSFLPATPLTSVR